MAERKVAIVTGASSGIGAATARKLSEKGFSVALLARRLENLKQISAEINDKGGEAEPFQVDVTDQARVRDVVSQVIEQWGRIDVLVANAGVYVRAPIVSMTVDDLRKSFNVNFYGAVYPVLETLPKMLEQGRGHIVLVTSMDGKKGLPPDGPYVAAKFALTGLGDVMRQELWHNGIKVTTVLPGRVDTPMIDDLKVPWISAKISSEKVAEAIVKSIDHYKPEVIVPFQAKLLYYVHVLSPRLSDAIVRWFHLEGWKE